MRFGHATLTSAKCGRVPNDIIGRASDYLSYTRILGWKLETLECNAYQLPTIVNKNKDKYLLFYSSKIFAM